MRPNLFIRRHLAGMITLFCATCLSTGVQALELKYEGEITFCSQSCDLFGALGAETGGSDNTINSMVTGVMDVPVDVGGNFDISPADNVLFELQITSSAIPFEDPVFQMPGAGCPPPDVPGQLCNPASVNPLTLSNMLGTVQGSGQIGEDGRPVSGELVVVPTVPPFSNIGVVFTFDLESGDSFSTLFSGALAFTEGVGRFNDDDNDTVGNAVDNCLTLPNPDQRDTDNDGYGNRCDGDLNNDCITVGQDLGIFRANFFTTFEDADFNGDGFVNALDLGILRTLFFSPPGPSANNSFCAP